MMHFASEADLVAPFREIDRAAVEQPDKQRFPLQVEDDVFTWSAGPRAFLVFRDRTDRPLRGIVFHRSTQAMPDVAAMCEWCHAVRGNGGVKLLTAASSSRRHVGLYLCSDLSCVEKTRAVPGPDDLQENLDSRARLEKVVARISTFASRRLY